MVLSAVEAGSVVVPAGVGRVADRGGVVEVEHLGRVEGIAAGEGFFKLPVDPQPFQGRGQTAQVQDESAADRAETERALLADQQVGVGGVGPAAESVLQPLDDHVVSQLAQRAGSVGDGEFPVTQVDVVELQGSDLAGTGGVDGGQGEAQPRLWSSRLAQPAAFASAHPLEC